MIQKQYILLHILKNIQVSVRAEKKNSETLIYLLQSSAVSKKSYVHGWPDSRKKD